MLIPVAGIRGQGDLIPAERGRELSYYRVEISPSNSKIQKISAFSHVIRVPLTIFQRPEGPLVPLTLAMSPFLVTFARAHYDPESFILIINPCDVFFFCTCAHHWKDRCFLKKWTDRNSRRWSCRNDGSRLKFVFRIS